MVDRKLSFILVFIFLAPIAFADCFSSLQNIPVSCDGTITSDTYNGCRTIVCQNGGDTTQVLGCDKPSSTSPQYFEMYKQAQTGIPREVCFGNTCISSNGYAKSSNYPFCEGSTSPPPPPPNSSCGTSVQTLPLTCNGGSVTQDTYDGCRHITCQGSGSIQVLACDKGGFFEMYKQGQAGAPPQVCLGNTCIKDDGFVKSSGYTCGGTTTPPPPPPPPPPPSNSSCYNSVQQAPVSCQGGTFTADTFNGCRTLVCSSGNSNMQVLACDKSGFFEMYKQSQSGTAINQICLGSTCISNNGYAKSTNFPICTGGTGGGSGGTTSIVWIEPADNQQNTPPNFFHLNVQVPSNEANIPSTEWEVWNNAMTERVWFASNTGSLRFHTHTPDGSFQGSLAGKTQLAFSTTYKVRIRFKFTNGTFSDWSTTRTFTTSAAPTGGLQLWTPAAGFQVERFATGFDVPVHIAFAPTGMYSGFPTNQQPYLYVTELYGQIKVVYKDGSSSTYASNILNFDPFGSITGGGQMGLIGLYVDDQTGDLIVGTTYIENSQVKNKVIKFITSNDGRTSTGQQTLISGLPSSPSHQVEQITKGPDGKIYIQLGDGLNEQNAQNDGILAGKIIRMNMDGSGVETYAKGFRNPFGGDWRPGTNQLFVTDNSPNTNDRLLRVTQGGNYLWGTGGNAYVGQAIDLLNPSPVDVEFNPGGKGFPTTLNGRMYVAVAGPIYQKGQTNGKEILEYTIDGGGNIIGKRQFLKYTGSGYGTPIGLDFGPEGLYFTDIYGEPGFVGLGETEGNIYRIVPGNGGCIGCGAPGSFRAGISVAPWYPKDTGNGIEYIFECQGIDGSGSYKYDWDFGNGQKQFDYTQTRIGPKVYPYGNTDYIVSCTVKDQTTGQRASASMAINPNEFIAEK